MSDSIPAMPSEVARVQAALDELESGLRVHLYDVPTNTAGAAAAAAGCVPGQIVKSMLFIADGRPVLLLVAGDRRVDTNRLGLLLGVKRKRIRLATAAEVETMTGFEVGGVAPLGHPAPIETIFDSALDRFPTVFAAAGSGNAVFETEPDRLVRLTGARRAEFTS